MKETLQAFFSKHWKTILGAAAGVVLAILFLTLGFWRTILIVLLLAFGAGLGVGLERGQSATEVFLAWGMSVKRFFKAVALFFRTRFNS